MKTIRQLKLILLLIALLGLYFPTLAQHNHPHGERAEQATIKFDIGKGNITFTNTSYSGKNSSGQTVSGTHNESNIYEISGNSSSTLSSGDKYAIKIGTPSTPVSKDFIIKLCGLTILGRHLDNTNHAAPIYVNNSAKTVFLILADGTTNYVKGYGRSNYQDQNSYAHAGIEKEINTQGKLVVTCEQGYANYLNNNNTGHTCSADDDCGSLTAVGSGDTYRPRSGGAWGNLRVFCGAAIGSAGTVSGAEGALHNLIIAGGKINAYCMWDHLSESLVNDDEDFASFAAAIGVGAAYGGSSYGSTGYIKITGGKINARGGNGAAACIGGGYRSKDVTVDIYGGDITAMDRYQNHTAYPAVQYRGTGIGVGGGGEITGSEGRGTVNIYGGTIRAYSEYGAAIGGAAGGTSGGARPAFVNIYGGNITATTLYGGGAGIGTGGSIGQGTAAQATVNIYGGTINACSEHGADIGGGGTNSTDAVAVGGIGVVTISGGTITTTGGGIGGGMANAGVGGNAEINISGGTITATSIGGGNSSTNNAGTATVYVSGTADITLTSGGVGGGNSTDPSTTGNGGDSNVIISGGSLNSNGSIGGGKSFGTGNGGNASIYVTGGSLSCASIGGGESDGGLPGAVAHAERAGVQIEGGTVITGSIGGGINSAGDIGKATAKITGGNIQGQFLLSNSTSTSTDHCYFTMTGGTIDNTNLGTGIYEQAKADGGAVYMEDANGVVTISGGTIKNCKAVNGYGGAVYMDKPSAGTFNGSFTLSGNAVIESCQASGSTESGNVGCGGAVYMRAGTFTMSGGQIKKCTAENRGGAVFLGGGEMTISGGTIGGESLTDGNSGYHGGGIYVTDATFTMIGGSFKYNKSIPGDGGGLCISGGSDITIKGGSIQGNQALTGIGGGMYLNPGSGRTTYVNSEVATTTISGNKAINGAGAFIRSGILNIASSTTSISSNTATNYGGGVYMAGGSVIMNSGNLKTNTATNNDGGGIYIADGGTVIVKGGTIQDNQALKGNGGGFYVNPGTGKTTTINSDNSDTNITGNKAKNGGGAYIASGKLSVASTNGNTTSICNNTATVNGGGFYAGSDVEVVSGTICDNSAVNGAGFYSASGSVQVMSNSSISGNTATANGGGIYAAGGDVTVDPDNVSVEVLSDNHADNGNGGAIYAGGGNVHFENGTITGNSANNGGAIYANGGTVTFRDGYISNNHALARGGGLYITESGNLALQGTAKLIRNHVPSAGEGGGVYLAGVVYVGSEGGTSTSPKPDAIIAEDNFADDDPSATVTWNNRNNIFLPKPRVNSGHKDVITIYPYGMSLNSGSGTHTHVGFSVPRNFVPVIYCDNWKYLRDNKEALVASVFDDSELYYTVWNSDLPYNKNYIYLSGLLWTEVVYQWPMTGCPASGFEVDADSNVTIRTKEGFAWLISYVNGRADDYPSDPHDMAGKKVTIDLAVGENLDMHQYGWVPIGYGENGKEFKGEFEGNGNSISGIIVTYGNDQGVFGDVTGSAKISNVFISNTALSSMRYDVGTYYMGGLACKVGDNAEVFGCGANGPMDCLDLATGVVMGGLVGKLYGNAKIHSCYATPEMEGYTMGGLIGEMDGGTVENCFSYPKFVAYDASTAYIGGLTAKMTDGRFENCYTHELSGSSHGAGGNFGWFAGDYEAGVFNYCYAPENANYVHTGTLGAESGEGYGWFSPTALVDGKYGFKHQDQDVTKAFGAHTNDFIENGIVDENGYLKGLLATLNNWVEAQGTDTQYSTWMRTMGSHVNLDLPVLEYTGETCVGSETGAITYSKDVNDLLGDFLDGDIYLYGTNPKQVSKGTKTNVRLYIKPNVGILQTASASLNARVGVLLDNSKGDAELGGLPYDWHMFSTPLNNAPLGLTYNPNGVSYTPAYGIDPPQVAIGAGCYFPTNTPYGAPYTSDGSFDYYCYSEKDCHWINFKRDSNDHWRQDGNHDQITYRNESTLIPGKGYMLAVSYPTMVMADGKLNNGDLNYTATNSDMGGYDAPLKGVNLIGNPYQSYLNFDEFVNGNPGKVLGNTYFILDADSTSYLAYTAESTDNGIGAPGYLHPHQGFLVKVADAQTTLEFSNTMRSAKGNADTHFRGERPAYPLVNMVCTDAKGMKDYTTIELNRPDQGGGQKIGGLRTGDASVWFHLDDEDWQTAFTREGLQEAPLRFKAYADGTYTMHWSTLNGDFLYLHLVDNKTGIDTDCLLTQEYKFTATTHDYLSRFTLVFECTGVEEDGSSTGSETFAFMMGDELVVNGEGMLQVYDMSGRLLAERELHGTQSTVSLPRVSNGMYLLRLRSASQVRVQKMVINK